MDFRVTVSGFPELFGRERELWVSAPAEVTAESVVAACLTKFGIRDQPVAVDGVRVAGDSSSLGESDLRDGAVLTPAGRSSASAWRLGVASGTSVGQSFDLVPGVYVLGRSPSCDLVINDPEVSRRQLELQVTSSSISCRDLGSTNGTLISGSPLPPTWVDLPAGSRIEVGGSVLVLHSTTKAAAAVAPDGAGGLVVNRRYRIWPKQVSRSVELPTPVGVPQRRPFPWLAALAPLVVAVALAAVLKQPTFLLFAALSPITMVASQWTDRKSDRRRMDRETAAYEAARQAAESQIAAAIHDDLDAWQASMPDPLEINEIAAGLTPRLWERQPSDPDFLALRLGLGPRAAQIDVRRPAGAPEANITVPSAPIGVILTSSPVLGVAGQEAAVISALGSAVMQLATLHSPEDVRVVVLAPQARQSDWGFLRWLPHCMDRPTGTTLLGHDHATIDARVRELGDVVKDRRTRRNSGTGRQTAPVIVVVLVAAHRLRRLPDVANLLQNGPEVGLRFICGDLDQRMLPQECTSVMLIDALGRAELQSSESADGRQDLLVDHFDAAASERAARAMAPARSVVGESGGSLPGHLRLLDLLGMPVPSAALITSRWTHARSRTSVPVGVTTSGEFAVDIAKDGPHALVAGTTGSGKSEFLQTLIASLLAGNPPESLSFLFIDFKGGAAFLPFRELPHTVGFVTNLDGRLVERALATLRAELDRRQIQLNRARAKDIGDYLRTRAKDRQLPPFPRLVIVIDEFAEMKEQFEGFVDGVVAAARVGRSMGVHLILATQRPHGVVSPEIRSNANLRVCFRVRDVTDSLDVIEIPDAASISPSVPGRGYLGSGEGAPNVFQSARVGGRAATRLADTSPLVWPTDWSEVGKPRPREEGSSAESTDLDILVQAVKTAAAESNLVAPFHPWKQPLPTVLSLSDIDVSNVPPPEHSSPALTLGMRDIPSQQMQIPWTFPLATGHLAFIGGLRTGRTSALRTFAVALTATLPVPDAHFWVLDGGHGLAALGQFPHCGAVIPATDAARVDRLLALIDAEVQRRLADLVNQGFADITEQREAVSDADQLPYMVLLVDRWEALAERYANTATGDALLRLLDEGPAAGLTVVIAGDETLLRGRLPDRLGTRLLLHINDPTMAMSAGLNPKQVPAPDLPGRGVLPDGSEVQVALLSADLSGAAQTAALRAAAAAARRESQDVAAGRRPFALVPLPARVRRSELPTDRPVLGLCGDDAAPTVLDPGSLLVVGPSGSGRSTALASAARAAAEAGTSVRVVGSGPVWDQLATTASIARLEITRLEPDSDQQWRALVAGADGLLVIDDLDRVRAPQLLSALAEARDDARVYASAELGSFALAPPAHLRIMLRVPGSTLVLCPPDHLQAAYVGLKLARGKGFNAPPGRGLLMRRGGVVVPIQVALPD